MLTKGSTILVREEGGKCPVEALQISDFVFDPLADKYCEIIDILSRDISISDHPGERSDHPLRPIVIEADMMGAGRPLQKTLVSPSQPILTIQRNGESTIPTIDITTAVGLTGRSETIPKFFSSEFTTVTYFALFTAKHQFIDFPPNGFKPPASSRSALANLFVIFSPEF